MNIHIIKTLPELIKAMAFNFIKVANDAIASRGEFNVVLAGGNSPRKLYELLASSECNQEIDWTKVNFFFGDERYVPANDPDNNAFMVEKALFNPLQISASNIFPIDTSVSPEKSAQNYTEIIVKHFGKHKLQFDLILLGLGDNGHTASLFPYTSVLLDNSSSVQVVELSKKNIRITMTAQLINQARNIAFFVYGQGKAEAVQHIIENKWEPEKFPAQLIKPESGELHWFLDETAATLLKNNC